jgi:GWxTD domain-containing protein
MALVRPAVSQVRPFSHFIEQEETLFPVDWAAFANDSTDSIRLEIYYKVPNSSLEFTAKGNHFVARYKVSIKLYGKKDKLVNSYEKEKTVRSGTKRQTRSRLEYRTNQVNFDVIEGKYKVRASLEGSSDQASIRREFKLKLRSLRDKVTRLSEVELVETAGARKDKPGPFNKGDLSVVPKVSSDFAGGKGHKLLYYLEIYQGSDSADHVVVQTILRSASGKMMYRDTLTSPLEQRTVRQIRNVSLEEIPPGDYSLEIELKGRRNKKIDSRKKDFSVVWNHRATLEGDYKTALEQISYIARPDEIEVLKKLTTLEERLKAIEAFWKERDPTLGTAQNEFRDEFYRRIIIANRNFRFMRRPGWRTDRGRIYIQYGEPDQVDDYPYLPNRWPLQIWHYHEKGRYRRFSFEDANGDGDFRLQYPFDGLYQRPDF